VKAMNSNLFTLSELTHDNATKYAGGFITNNDCKKLILLQKSLMTGN
jgi:hypothetical protein